MSDFQKEFTKDYMDSVLVIYHKEDNDGACSAGIVKAFLQKYAKVSYIDFLGTTYPDLAKIWKNFKDVCFTTGMHHTYKPDMLGWLDAYDTIFMVDISFNDPLAMDQLYIWLGDSFIWCDHHKPAIEISKEYCYGKTSGIRCMDQSALANTWDYMVDLFDPKTKDGNGFLKKIRVPKELVLLSDYDSWAWSRKSEYEDEIKRKEMFNFNTGMTEISNLNPEWFAEWIGLWLDGKYVKYSKFATDAYTQGELIRKLDGKRIRKAVEEHGDMNWILAGTRKCCMIFTTEHMNSQSFDSISDPEIRNGATLKYNSSNDCWTMSLYNLNNDDEFDCGVYLKEHYGGGGHKGAAGCTLSNEQVSNLMLTKRI